GPFEVLRVCLPPRLVDDAGALSSAAEQDAVPRPVAVLTGIELDKIPFLAYLPDVHGDREHRVRHGEDARGAARRFAREHEPGEVGAGLRRGGDVLLTCESADLHERARDQLDELRGR